MAQPSKEELERFLLSVLPEPGPNQKVIWEYWKIAQSEFHYREPGVVDLGEIDE
jgi:hypothetical protein